MVFSIRGSLRTFLEISPEETSFSRHNFHCGEPSVQQHLERCALSFVSGYNIALACSSNDALVAELEQVEQQFKGFAYEGAGMALAILDFMLPGHTRFLPLTLSAGNDYIYLLYVGWGWSMGRLPRKRISASTRTPYDPLLLWLAYDGYGFHEGFFSWEKSYLRQRYPFGLPKGYARRAFDQGLGRGLWFVGCGDIAYIAERIAAFSASRQADLWSGVGLAASYAGGVTDDTLERLRHIATPFYPHLAQGAAFAIRARHRAHSVLPHTLRASEILCGCDVEDVVRIVESALAHLPFDQAEPAFEHWRRRIQTSLGAVVPASEVSF
jgi:enediyne biosynthesis protein E3